VLSILFFNSILVVNIWLESKKHKEFFMRSFDPKIRHIRHKVQLMSNFKEMPSKQVLKSLPNHLIRGISLLRFTQTFRTTIEFNTIATKILNHLNFNQIRSQL
jgi:hypothetical protein